MWGGLFGCVPYSPSSNLFPTQAPIAFRESKAKIILSAAGLQPIRWLSGDTDLKIFRALFAKTSSRAAEQRVHARTGTWAMSSLPAGAGVVLMNSASASPSTQMPEPEDTSPSFPMFEARRPTPYFSVQLCWASVALGGEILFTHHVGNAYCCSRGS